MAEAGVCAVETTGRSAEGAAHAATAGGAVSDGESSRNALSLRVTEDRILIKADRDDHAPTQTEAGLYVAQSMAAAVDGADEADSWFVGTIVQIGPLVNHRDCRRTLKLWLLEMEESGHDVCVAEIVALRQRVEDMPADMPDPLKVGDRVFFSWASGQQIALDGERFLIMREGDVLGKWEE